MIEGEWVQKLIHPLFFNFKNKIVKEIEKLTTMRVQTIKIIIKEIHINKEEIN